MLLVSGVSFVYLRALGGKRFRILTRYQILAGQGIIAARCDTIIPAGAGPTRLTVWWKMGILY